MNLRTVILVCAAVGIPLALLALALPITWGYGGYNFVARSPSVVYFSDPSGPAYAAGLRVGQPVLPNRGDAYVQEDAGPIGTVVREHIVGTNGKVHIISFAFVPFSGPLGVQQQINKIVNALTAMGAFVVAILVLLRARNREVGTRAASVLFFSGIGALALSGALVCGNAWCAEIFARFLPGVFTAAAYWSAFSLLAIYPPNRTTFRRRISWFGPAQMALAIGGVYSQAHFVATGASDLGQLFFNGKAGAAVSLIFTFALAAAILDAFVSAKREDAAPVRWLGGMWLIAAAFATAPPLETLAGGTTLQTHYGDFVNAAGVLFFAFGVAYPVLRHRLVDLNILVSRATVFTLVSLIIVAIFIAAEWGIAKVFEQSFGLSHDRGGLAAQLITLFIVLILGMSARSIHRFVEQRLTRAFFRKRLQGLAHIERLAREADAATDAEELMQLGVQTVKHALAPLGVAYYLNRGERYDRCADAEAEKFPRAYGLNEGPPLRLRRWQEAFETDDDSDDRLHMLFVPMTVRGNLIGFLCCGPKPDRTRYLEDEIHALSLLAHHTAIATALLPHSAPGVMGGLALTPA